MNTNILDNIEFLKNAEEKLNAKMAGDKDVTLDDIKEALGIWKIVISN